jgi:Mg/Co/Ni transporter MgtE
MTIHATRARMLSMLLRTGNSARIARCLDRLDAGDLSRLLVDVQGIELRRAAQVLLSENRVAYSLEALDPPTLAHLINVACVESSVGALRRIGPREANQILSRLPKQKRTQLKGAMSATRVSRAPAFFCRTPEMGDQETRLGAALRLHRLFA